jgi:hypothetical protein
MIEKVDSFVIDYALKNTKTFFGKELSRDVISAYYNSGIKLSKKEQYSDNFKIKLLFLKPNPEKNLPNGKFITSFWTTKGDEECYSYIDKWDSVKCLIKPQMLWVANKGFGVSWVCTQVCVHKQQKISGFSFKKTGDTDEDEEAPTLLSDEEYVEEEVEVDA